MKAETDELYAKIEEMQEATRDFNSASDGFDADIRDTGKKVGKFETNLEEIMEKLMQSSAKMDEADNIVKECRKWENNTMNNEVEIETTDNNQREARKIASDNEMKYDNLARSLAMMEDELKRAGERVKIADDKVSHIETELQAIGDNQKQLEISEEKARKREEKYQEQIKQINIRLKQAESRSEYAEMNISKLHLT